MTQGLAEAAPPGARPAPTPRFSESELAALDGLVDAITPAAKGNLNARQLAILLFLAGNPEVSHREIIARFGFTMGTTTRNVLSLANKHLVESAIDAIDHRLRRLTLTPSGLRQAQAFLNTPR